MDNIPDFSPSSKKDDVEGIKFDQYKPRFRAYFMLYILAFLGACGIFGYFIFLAVRDYSGD